MKTSTKSEQQYKEFESRSAKLMPLFKITSFIHKHRIFRPFLYIPSPLLNQWAHLLAPVMLKKPRLKTQIFSGLEALYHNKKLTLTQKQNLYHANAVYMGMLYLDAMFHSSNLYENTLNHFVHFENFHFLHEALTKGKGAIIVATHVGMFFQILGSLAYVRPKIQITTVIQPRNRVMYENILSRPELTNFHVVPSTSFKKLKPILKKRLQQNHLIVVYYDYSRAHQLRVPFEAKKYPYLITTPQSIFKLHKIYGTPIIPAKIYPRGEFGKSRITFLDPEPLLRTSSRYSASPEKVFLGEMSTHLNQIFAPYLRKMNHLWEEFRKLTTRCSDYFEMDPSWTLAMLCNQIEEKSAAILTQSYESNRPDEKIKILLSEFFSTLKTGIERPLQTISASMSNLPQSINLSFKSATGEIQTLFTYLETILMKVNESQGSKIVSQYSNNLRKIV